MNYIKISKPADAISKRVEAEIRQLAQAGSRSKDIQLYCEFFTVEADEIFRAFNRLKNRVFMSLDAARF
jgi:DNA-directed RNA polymerase specialized sigma subunit